MNQESIINININLLDIQLLSNTVLRVIESTAIPSEASPRIIL